MSGPKSWAGETELQSAMQELCGHNPVPTSKIRQAVTVANKYSNDYKMVVYEIEKFIKKADLGDKIAGISVLDSLCRQHSKERETFSKRFAIRLKETTSFLVKCSSKDRSTLARFLKLWREKDIFPGSVLQSIVHIYGVPDESQAAAPQSTQSTQSHTMTEDSSSVSSVLQEQDHDIAGDGRLEHNNMTGRQRPKPQEQLHATMLDQGKVLKAAAKLCPFRDSGCPFGDKCKFNHHEVNTLEQYTRRLPILKESGCDNSDDNQHNSSNKFIIVSNEDLRTLLPYSQYFVPARERRVVDCFDESQGKKATRREVPGDFSPPLPSLGIKFYQIPADFTMEQRET